MTSLLPPVGTTYPSFNHFKLDMFERGVQHSTNQIVRNSNPGLRLQIGCNIQDENGTYCDLRVSTEFVDGQVIVVRLVADHTCSEQEREDRRESTKIKLREKIRKVKEEIRGMGTGFSTRSSTRELQSRLEIEASDGDDSSEEANSVDGSHSKVDSDSSVEEPLYKKPKHTRPRSEAFLNICPPAREIQTEIDEVKKRGVASLPSPESTFDSLRGLLTVLFAYSQQRNYSISRRVPELKDGVGAILLMKCYRSNARYKTAPNGGRCKFELHGLKTDDGKWRFEKVVGSHNHPVLELAEGDNQVKKGDDQPKEAAAQETNEAKLDSTKFQPFALPASRLPHASTSTLPSLTSMSNMAPPPPRPVTTTSTASSLSSPPDLVSFLRAFDSSPSNLAHTLLTLRSSGINDLDTLIGILAMEDENLARFVEMLSDKMVGKRIMEMAEDLRREFS